MKQIITKLQEIKNNRYITYIGVVVSILILLIAVADFSAVVTKSEITPSLRNMYEKGYIDGFRKARSYEIKDTTELNHIYPTYKLMVEYEPMKKDTIGH